MNTLRISKNYMECIVLKNIYKQLKKVLLLTNKVCKQGGEKITGNFCNSKNKLMTKKKNGDLQ